MEYCHEELDISHDENFEDALKNLATDAHELMKHVLTKEPTIISWNLGELSPEEVLCRPAFEPTDNTPACLPVRRMALKYNRVIKKEIKNMLDAEIVQPTTPPRRFLVVIARNKDGSPRFFVNYRML